MRLALFVALLLAPALAAAVELGASVGWVTELSGPKKNGPGIDLRLGGTSHAGEVAVTSEIGAILLAPGSTRTYGGVVGWRLRFGELVQPGVIVHLGLGHHAGGGLVSFTDGLYDVGGLLDFHVIPRLEMGLHVQYGGFFSGARSLSGSVTCLPADSSCAIAENPTWLSYGLHGSFRF